VTILIQGCSCRDLEVTSFSFLSIFISLGNWCPGKVSTWLMSVKSFQYLQSAYVHLMLQYQVAPCLGSLAIRAGASMTWGSSYVQRPNHMVFDCKFELLAWWTCLDHMSSMGGLVGFNIMQRGCCCWHLGLFCAIVLLVWFKVKLMIVALLCKRSAWWITKWTVAHVSTFCILIVHILFIGIERWWLGVEHYPIDG